MTPLFEHKFEEGEFFVYHKKPIEPLIQCHQVHSNIIIEYEQADLTNIEADGIIIDPIKYPEKIIAIKTADCLPVLLIGKKIALIHAGWRGLQNKILIDHKIKDLEIEKILIGPAIQNYEVQPEFRNEFPKSDAFYNNDGKLFFNLQKEALSQLQVNYPTVKVYNSEICTFKNSNYNSYRRNKTTQRNWNIFKIN